jgi:DNA repair exonuclease SbcCD nuclease subunit
MVTDTTVTPIPVDTLDAGRFRYIYMIADLHIGVRNGLPEWIDNIRDYFDNWLIPVLRSRDLKESALFVLGDTLDNRKHTPLEAENLMIRVFKELAALLPVYVIVGNHDMLTKTGHDITGVKSLELIDNLTLVSDPAIVETFFYDYVRKILMVPHMGDCQVENRILKQVCDSSDVDIVMLHTDIDRMKYDNGRDITSGTNVDDVKCRKVYSGHIHKRQETKKATYIGSPYHLDRKDTGNDKGVYVLDLMSMKEEFIQNDRSPKFIRCLMSDLLKCTAGQVREFIRNNYVDIYVTKEEDERINQGMMSAGMGYMAAKTVQVWPLGKYNDAIAGPDTDAAYKDMTVQDIVGEMIDSLDVTPEQKERIRAMNQRFVEGLNENAC